MNTPDIVSQHVIKWCKYHYGFEETRLSLDDLINDVCGNSRETRLGFKGKLSLLADAAACLNISHRSISESLTYHAFQYVGCLSTYHLDEFHASKLTFVLDAYEASIRNARVDTIIELPENIA